MNMRPTFTPMSSNPTFWLLTTSLVAACNSNDGSNSEWSASIRDSAGIQIVENPAQGIWSDESRWALEEDLRIGAVEGEPEYQFGEIVGLQAGPDGEILVLDMEADRPFRVFDSEGQFLASHGGRGGGPGEFGAGAGPILRAGDSLLAIPDWANNRVSLFRSDGVYHRSIPATLTEPASRWGVTSRGIPVLQVGLSAMAGMQANDDLVDVLLAIGPDGRSRDTLLTFPSSRQFFFEGGMPELTFFAPEPFWVIAPSDAVYLGINNEYAIGIYEGGALRGVVSRAYTPLAVGDRDREVVLDAWIRVFSEQIPNAEITLRQLAQFHDVFPAYQQFKVSPDGSLWVQQTLIPSQLSEQESDSFDPTGGWGARQWDVFDAEGLYLGELELPHRFELMALQTDFVVGVWRDELDVQYVKRLRIVKQL